ncbi:CrcB protein [Nakamurella sp. UYEF19]|uniref:fluoride efflux transporter CrcB n=1 Tax=Nakamurella sp. UYEF19 TaxID=1756392 RepID=UPI00339897BC
MTRRRVVLSALEPADSDVDLDDPAQRRELWRKHGLVLLVIAAGGVIGSLLRYQLGRSWPTHAPGFPWTTSAINLTGSFVIGVLLVVITERRAGHPLVRPFFGTGVLGGYTTFSTYAVDAVLLVRSGHPGTAALYVFGTLAGALAAVTAGMWLARRIGSGGSGGSDGGPSGGAAGRR